MGTDCHRRAMHTCVYVMVSLTAVISSKLGSYMPKLNSTGRCNSGVRTSGTWATDDRPHDGRAPHRRGWDGTASRYDQGTAHMSSTTLATETARQRCQPAGDVQGGGGSAPTLAKHRSASERMDSRTRCCSCACCWSSDVPGSSAASPASSSFGMKHEYCARRA